MNTLFAPAEVAPFQTLKRQHTIFMGAEQLVEALDTLPEGLLVLNRQRQIVFANRAFCALVGVTEHDLLLGLRPGEAVACVRVAGLGCRCGTTEHCQACGAVEAILASQAGEIETRECRILRTADPGALDLRVRAAPFRMEDEEFTLLLLQDIAHEKRRAALERIFFHDVLNTAGNIRSLAELMKGANAEELTQYRDLLDQLSAELTGQIRAQRDLLSAEAGELGIRPVRVNGTELLRNVAAPFGSAVTLESPAEPHSVDLVTDPILLGRVLSNMVKNAVEAAEPGETVRAGVERSGGSVMFWVRNRAVLPPRVRLQIFQRSFSTKGPGRGLGTYSMQLLTEKYLGGSVSFTTAEVEGTTFRVSLPLVPPGKTATS